MITESKLSELLTTPDPWVVWWEREALIAEIRHLRDENVRLRDNVRDEALKMVEDMYPSSEVR